MIHLLTAEAMRIRSRRITWIVLLGAIVGVFLVVWGVSSVIGPMSQEQVSAATAQFEEQHKAWEEHKHTCEPAKECPEPKLADYLYHGLPYDGAMRSAASPAAYLSFLAAMVIGASVVAAEFATGAMSNLVSFVPNRTRVYSAKLLAIMLTSALASLVILALSAGATALVFALVRGTTTMTGTAWLEVAARGLGVGVLGGILGASLAFILRHTAAVVGVVLGYGFVSGAGYAAFNYLRFRQGFAFLPDVALSAIIDGERTIHLWSPSTTTPEGSDAFVTVTALNGLGVWMLYGLFLIAVSWWVFRKRDIA